MSKPVGILILILIVVAALYGIWHTFHSGELGDKPAWAALQAVELQHRTAVPPAEPLLVEHIGGSDFSAVGLPTGTTEYSFAWLLVSGGGNGPVKIIPQDAHVKVTCGYVSNLKKQLSIQPAAADYLNSICTP
jgi:hypothetical protein